MTESKSDDKTTAGKSDDTKAADSKTTESKTTAAKSTDSTQSKTPETKSTSTAKTESAPKTESKSSDEKPKTEVKSGDPAKERPVTNETNYQVEVEKPNPNLANPSPTTGSVDGVMELNQRLSERSAGEALKDAETKAERDEKVREEVAKAQARRSEDGESDTFADIERRFTLARQIDTTTGDPSTQVFQALVEPPARFVTEENEKK